MTNRRTFLTSAAACAPGVFLLPEISKAQAGAPVMSKLEPNSIPVG